MNEEETEKFTGFVDWKICLKCGQRSGHGVLRVFELPLGDLAAFDDMPIKGYVWIVNVSDFGEKGFHIEGTMNRPPKGSIHELFRLARALGRDKLTWDRVDDKTGLVHRVEIRFDAVTGRWRPYRPNGAKD